MTRVKDMLRSRDVVIAVTGLTLIVLIAIFGSLLAPYDPLKLNADASLQAPGPAHWLGTDYIGRDVLSRLLAGAQLSLLSAAEAVIVGLVLGVIPGLITVYGPRSIEWLTLRFSDAVLALPFIVFAISFAAILGNGLHQAMFAVGVLFAPTFYRVTRAAVLETNNEQYIEASLFLGASTAWIITRHVWSKVAPTIAVTAVNALAGALLVVSSLTFLGIGVQPPTPTWGGMLASDLNYLSQRPDGPVAPAALIMITVALLNLLADSIRDAFDHKRDLRTPPQRDAVVDIRENERVVPHGSPF